MRECSMTAKPRSSRPMRDSGIPWIGRIPAGWEVRRLKSQLLANDCGAWGKDPVEDGSDTIVLRSMEQTIDGGLEIREPAKRHLSQEDARRTVLEVGDLVITKSSGSQEHIGKTSFISETVANLNCCFSNFLQRLRVKGESRLFWYLLNSQIAKRQFEYLATTTTGLKNLTATIIGNLVFPLPPLAEQRAIAAYLDKKCAAIDAAVAEANKADRRKTFRPLGYRLRFVFGIIQKTND